MIEVRLERIRQLSNTTKDFRFVRTDGDVFDYTPGQFFRFLLTDEQGEFERSYSPCNFEELHGDYLDVVISEVEGGRATRLLFETGEGLTARLHGPFGRLVAPSTRPERLVLVATSVGLAPFLPILKQLEGDTQKIVLLLGVRDESEFLYRDWLLNYRDNHKNFELRLCYSRDEPREVYEYKGYVTEQLELIDPNPEEDHFLLCGNPHMIDDVWPRLKESGFRARQVTREKYVFAKDSKGEAKKLTDKERALIAEKMKKYR